MIAHLVLSPEFKIAGIVTTHAPNLAENQLPTKDPQGNDLPAAEITAHVAHEVLDQVKPDLKIPVFAGSSLPLNDKSHPRDNKGVQFILDQSRSFSPEHRLNILVLGAATDVASALLTDPSLQDRISIVAVAFTSWPKGVDGFNVKNDVKAWQILFESKAPITIADGAVTTRDLSLNRKQAAQILGAHGKAGAYLEHLVDRWLDRNAALATDTTGKDAWPIWDEATVAYLLGYTHSNKHMRPVLQDDTKLDIEVQTNESINWITSIDSSKLWKDLDEKLDRGNK